MKENTNSQFQNFNKWAKIIFVLAALAFISGCFFPFDFFHLSDNPVKSLLVVFCYYQFGGILKKLGTATNQWKFPVLITQSGIALGLVIRYFVEYGEVSNISNFTAHNIALYFITTNIITFLAFLKENK